MSIERLHVVSWRDLDDPEAGGSELHINQLARRWAASGLDVVIRTGAVRGAEADISRDGYRVVRRGGRVTGLVRSPLSEVLRRQGRRDALVEVWHGINFLAPLWCRGPRVAIAHHVHGEQFRYVLPAPAAGAARFVERRVSPLVYRHTPLVTLSPSTREELIGLGHAPSNVHVVPPGVDQRFSPGGRRASHPVVLTVGRLMSQKRVDEVFEALRPLRARFPDLEHVVVGSGPDETRLRRLAPPWVRFAGRVSDDGLVDLYRSAWVVASASVAEGWNMTLTEAGACATPAIASRIAGHVDAVVDGETGFLAGDRLSFTDKLDLVLSDGLLRARLGESAARHSRRHTWDAASSAVLDVLRAGPSRVAHRDRG